VHSSVADVRDASSAIFRNWQISEQPDKAVHHYLETDGAHTLCREVRSGRQQEQRPFVTIVKRDE